jgi:hypothetical protein
MLDDFFQYAAELQESLEQQGEGERLLYTLESGILVS